MNRTSPLTAWRSIAAGGIVLGCCLLASAGARAADYPDRPVRFIVATEAGGTADFVARQVAQRLSQAWPRGVIVENRPGAGGILGTDFVSNSAPDGYTLGLFTTSFTTNAAANPKQPYDARKDFVPIVRAASGFYLLVVNPTIPVDSVAGLIALAKEKPGKIDYGSVGVGGSIHLATELFNNLAGIKMTHIPYKGTASDLSGLMSNQVQTTIVALVGTVNLAKAGKLKILGVTSAKRSALLPDVPAISETVPGYEFINWFGLLGPKGTPQDVVDTVRMNVQKVLRIKELQDVLNAQGAEPTPTGSSADFAAMIDKQLVQYSTLARRLNLRME